jgi:hypothetical protein
MEAHELRARELRHRQCGRARLRGARAEAEQLAREAVAISEGTDGLNGQGDAYADLAEVLLLGDQADAAGATFDRALDRYERKANLVMAQRMRDRLASAVA